jgi:hypothetical protein
MSEEKKEISCTIPLDSGFTHVLFNLASQGYSHIYARYSGSGDSGAIDEMYLVERGGVIEENKDDLPQLEEDAVLADIENDLFELLQDKIYSIADNADDWYNNDGGGGVIFISTEDYKYKGDHYVNVTESIHTDVEGTLGD